jgi:putative hemolysin
MLLKAVYSAFEYAIIEVNDSKIKTLAESDGKYLPLLDMISAPNKVRTSFSVARVFCVALIVITFMGSGWFNVWILRPVSNVLSHWVGFVPFAEYVAMLVFVVLLVVVMNVLTDVIPKRIADRNIDSVALTAVPYVKCIVILFKPLTLAIDGLSFVICKLFGLNTNNKSDAVTEEEILMMVEAGNETGILEESQKDMINNIFDFEDVNICDVMTHRKDIIAVDIKSKIADVVYVAINEGFSRIPVYQESIDNVVGIIYVKDLLSLVGCKDSEGFNVAQFVRKVMYVHEYCKCSELFESMTKKRFQMAIVVDEYGGTAGLITMEDLLEEIVGNIQDEYDQEEKEIEEISEGVYTMDGSTDAEEVCSMLGITLPEEHNYDTMSAFIVDLLGHIPDEDELATVEYQGVKFTVLIVEDNWISKIKASVNN